LGSAVAETLVLGGAVESHAASPIAPTAAPNAERNVERRIFFMLRRA
jgi:hypothetical protein